MKRLFILLVIGLGLITTKLKAQTVVVSHPVRRIVLVPPPARVKVIVPVNRLIVLRPPVVVTRTRRTIIYR
ncbi:hypothetical protein HDC92_002599 [Pedobacter sp. AK017]|uniref:hypothetical protein n=1 Tax=Pedobacter sp. AK017 TaxID=2723073 RepID=UPI001615418A|nr:hypothetical protein [Pedobacter sp. AK017]MBB5438915.1 hypothetical protein [Pedobacter sp. AK017]